MPKPKKFRSARKKATTSVMLRPSAAKQIGEALGLIAGIAAVFSSSNLFATDHQDQTVTEDADFEVVKPKLLTNADDGRK